jgi:hypothetical protein
MELYETPDVRYRYAVVNDQTVDPSTRRIVEVIR